jgi:hypothetical protein
MKIWIVIVLMFLLTVALIVFGPLATIWSLNTLFMLSIPFTFKTWLAALYLSGIVGGVVERLKRANKKD